MEIGPNRPMSIIFLHQKYVHDPKLWPVMNTAVGNDIKILANTLLTQIEPSNPGCFGRGSLRLWVVLAKFWGESIRPTPVVLAVGRFSPVGGEYFYLFCICWLGPSIYCLPNKNIRTAGVPK